MRDLVDRFLTEKRSTVGKKTTSDYRNRLVPLIEFAESQKAYRRWPTAADIDREFALEFRKALSQRLVGRNGRAASKQKLISPGQTFNVLDCARTLMNWAIDVRRALLPAGFLNPFIEDIVGNRPAKDPRRPPVFPIECRIKLAVNMDAWQLLHLSLSLLFPFRPEDCASLQIGDVNFEENWLRFGRGFEGRDFTKGRVAFTCPFPAEIKPLLLLCCAGRSDGPLLQSRSVFEGRRRPRLEINVGAATDHIEQALRNARPDELQTRQDQKILIRRTIRRMGGVSEDELAKEFASLKLQAGIKIGRFYDLRGSVTTDMRRANVSNDVVRYITGHALTDILNVYVSLDPASEMKPYFAAARPLTDAMLKRADELKIKLPISSEDLPRTGECGID
jgi:integrase